MEKPKVTITKRMMKMLSGDSPRERFLHRLHCVAIVLNGASASEVARIYGDSARTVAYWVTRFKKGGLQGLEDEERSGRPSKLSEQQLQKLKMFVAKSGKSPRMAEQIASYVNKKFGVSLTERQCWRILRRLRS